MIAETFRRFITAAVYFLIKFNWTLTLSLFGANFLSI